MSKAIAARRGIAAAFAAVVIALAVAVCPAWAYTQKEAIVSNGHGYSSPQYLVIHETANPGASAKNHVTYWGNNASTVSMAHYVMELDGSVVYHTQKDNRLAWHVGNGNYATVGIELAHATNKADFNSQYKEAVKWAGDYLLKKGWGIDRLISHNDCRYMWGGTDHTDPLSYFTKYGKSWSQFKADVKAYMADGSTPSGGSASGSTASNVKDVKIKYAAYVPGYGWLDTVTDSGSGSEGFAGIPYEGMTYVTMDVTRGEVKYQAHVKGGGWLPWVYGSDSDKSDFVYGAAGDGRVIDGIRAYYQTAKGEHWQQVYYRVQTVDRWGYLATVCDDGTTYGGDDYAGIYGEGIDRLQMEVEPDWPAMAA